MAKHKNLWCEFSMQGNTQHIVANPMQVTHLMALPTGGTAIYFSNGERVPVTAKIDEETEGLFATEEDGK